jgi:hypothetical protein
MKPKIYVVHGLRKDSRTTTLYQTLSFGKYAYGCDVTYVHGLGKVPTHPADADLVILTYEFLALRNLPIWNELVSRVEVLINASNSVILMPQDDYTLSEKLDDLAIKWNVDAIFSPISRDLETIYPRSSRIGIEIREALTGYIDESLLKMEPLFAKSWDQRSLDLGQRVRLLSSHFGKSAQRKGQLALEFSELAIEQGFKCDVSTNPADVFLGDDWFRFLGDTRFTIGRLGGASRTDPRGINANWAKRATILHKYGYESLGNLALRRMSSGKTGRFEAISPRIFEAAVLGTCQVLEEDSYLTGMKPWHHYIPLKPDLGNIEEVFEAMRHRSLGEEIAKNCAELLVHSGKYSYESLVKEVLEAAGLKVSQLDRDVTVVDSSDDLGIAVDKPGNEFDNVQTLAAGLFLNSRETQKSSCQQVLVDLIKSKQLPVESLALPWRSATSFQDPLAI